METRKIDNPEGRRLTHYKSAGQRTLSVPAERIFNEDQNQEAPYAGKEKEPDELAGRLSLGSGGNTDCLYSTVGNRTSNMARAQDLPRRLEAKGSTQGSQPVRRFAIAAGSLDAVLASFMQVTGLNAGAAKKEYSYCSFACCVSGLYTADQALKKLLADTGLSYRFTSTNNVMIELKSMTSSVDVTSNVDALATSSPKFSQTLLDTAQTINAVPQAVMQEQGVTTLRDALRNVAGISLAGENGEQGDNLTFGVYGP